MAVDLRGRKGARSDCTYVPQTRTCMGPAGESLQRPVSGRVTNRYVADHFCGSKGDCLPCAHRVLCLRMPDVTPVGQVAFFRGMVKRSQESHTSRMKPRIDSHEGRARHERRFGGLTSTSEFAVIRDRP